MRYLLLPALGVTLFSAAAAAQSSGNGFLFGRPSGSLVVRAGYAAANAKSDVFSFTSEQLTLDRRDFSSPSIDVDMGFALGRRTDLVLSGGYAGMSKKSEFRDFVDQNNAPIEQSTEFQRVPLTVNLRRYLTSPGRSIGSFAWIPAKFAPYLGVGAGAIWYRFRQTGDFIDFTTNDVFPATLSSASWAPAARALAGGEYTLSPRLALTAQASYLWANGRMSSDFSGFNRIDLSGLSTSVGLAARF
jgi:hypothetical protein